MKRQIEAMEGDVEGPAVEMPPEWFERALADIPETRAIEVEGARVHYLRWGDPAKPGLLLTHGNGAHAWWWAYIAPFFKDRFCVVSIDLSGMGDSEHRTHYSQALFGRELFAVAEHAGFFAGSEKPILVGHSFGGFVTLAAAAAHPDRLKAAVIVDSPVRPPGQEMSRPSRPGGRGHFVYQSEDQALQRFKLTPPQFCENLYILDYIGRKSLKAVEKGISWKFDPKLWQRFEGEDSSANMKRMTCPVALIRGEFSSLVTPEIDDYMASLLPGPVPRVTIPLARHHIMLDQPLAFVSGLKGLLAGWPAQGDER